MTRPKCKAEARWKYWREENCLFCKGKFVQYAKKMIKKLTTWIRHTILRKKSWVYGNLKSLTARKHVVDGRVEILCERSNPDHNIWCTAHSDHWDDFKANINPNRVQKKYKALRAWGDPPKKTNDSDS